MLRLGGIPPPCNTTHRDSICQIIQFSNKPYQTQLPFLSRGLGYQTPYHLRGQTHTNPFCVSASNSGSKGVNSLLEMDGFDDFEDDDDDDEDDEEGMFIPLRNMKDWLEKKPRGFGEGKVYDTTIEDKLLEEMQQSAQAQLANINKLKNSPENPTSEKEILRRERAPEVVPSGIRVRLFNLPKKKNIHKDLQLAFKGVPGIVNIVPAVAGNKKTRDPICKGFAFVDLKSQEDANRFVQIFSRQSINFGKTQKQIRCEVMSSKSPSSKHEQPADRSYGASQPAVPKSGEGPDAGSDIEDTSSESREIVFSDEFEGGDDNYIRAQMEDFNETLGSLSEDSIGVRKRVKDESSSNMLSSKQKGKVQGNVKKRVDKRKGSKVPKLNIPGSANRLKIKEKAVLTGVLSKYAMQAASEE